MNRIIRVKSEKGFTVINNAVFNSDLSLRAIGLLTFIIHLPDDWILYKKWLYKNMKEGRDAINGAWAELEQKGFIKSEPEKRNENGKFSGINHIVYDIPVISVENPVAVFPSTVKSAENQFTENPVTVNPLPETRQLLNTNKENTNEQSTNEVNTYVPAGTDAVVSGMSTDKEEKRKDGKIPENRTEEKKEHERYFSEIVAEVDNLDHVSAKTKIAEYITEKKPTFYEPYKALW